MNTLDLLVQPLFLVLVKPLAVLKKVLWLSGQIELLII